jgi:hypothetical protein
MPFEAIRPVTSGAIQNGSIVTLVFESGATSVQKRAPDLNQHESSGAMNIRTSGRFVQTQYYSS